MTALAEAHITAQQRLRVLASTAVAAAWASLPGYHQENLDEWLSTVLPLMAAAERQSVALTEAFVARAVGRQPLGVNPARITGAALRGGTDPAEVYRRPFVTVWTALGNGAEQRAAISEGLTRATSTAATDVQLAMRATLREVGQADRRIVGYRRVPDGGACEFCVLVAGQRYRTDQLMPIHSHCVAGDTNVWASAAPAGARSQATDFGAAHAATRRWYAGEVVVIGTAAGYQLTVTPNHPILTDRGWIAAGLLREGDSVISSRRSDGVVGDVPDEQHMPARIEEHFRARPVTELVTVPFAAEHFHGDVGDGEVDVVSVHGDLAPWMLTTLLEPSEHQPLPLRLRRATRLARKCDCGHHAGRSRLATLRRMGSSSAGRTRLSGLPRGADPVLLGTASKGDARALEMPLDRAAAHAEAFREGEHRFSSEVQLDSVRHLRRIDWSGHVFNLVTSQGWYTANAILTHNCGCGVDVITSANRGDFTGNPDNDLSVDGAAVREHGELGPVLVSPDHHFTEL